MPGTHECETVLLTSTLAHTAEHFNGTGGLWDQGLRLIYQVRLSRHKYTSRPPTKKCKPDPVPLLDRDVELKNKTITLRVESQFMRISRRLTSPWLFLFLAVAYIIGLSFFSRANSFMTPSDSWIGCTSTFWLANDGCGLDGASCAPFDDSTVDFRCPAQCASVVLQNPRTVGNEQTEWVPLIVGGGDDNWTYRGDTFICAAALQASVLFRSTFSAPIC